VGNGATTVVLVAEVARTWPSRTPLRLKLTAGRPKPKLAKPFPVIVKVEGGEARSIGFGVIELTLGGVRVSLTVSEVLPTSAQQQVPEAVWL
jgi:hypothetical protein